MSNRKKQESNVPESLQVQFYRLFGTSSKEASKKSMTNTEWKSILAKVLTELYNYLEANVETDGMHFYMLWTGLESARESLKDDHFWPGYVEGIIRLALILMGDYPDHRLRKGGRKKLDHYKLNFRRTLTYIQNSDQRLRTLKAASKSGLIPLSCNIRDVITEFREEYGYLASNKDFLWWFRENYPNDYAKIF